MCLSVYNRLKLRMVVLSLPFVNPKTLFELIYIEILFEKKLVKCHTNPFKLPKWCCHDMFAITQLFTASEAQVLFSLWSQFSKSADICLLFTPSSFGFSNSVDWKCISFICLEINHYDSQQVLIVEPNHVHVTGQMIRNLVVVWLFLFHHVIIPLLLSPLIRRLNVLPFKSLDFAFFVV